MIQIKEEISKNLLEILKELGSSQDQVVVELPENLQFGDLTSNIAMQISKELRISPLELAKEISQRYPKDEYVEKVEVAGPGFLNFYLSDRYLVEDIEEICSKEKNPFQIDLNIGQRYMVEYTDPNPFKIFHIGHLYTNTIGEAFARLLEALGASVSRSNYQGDVGLHVAKTMYGLELLFNQEEISFEELSKRSLIEKVEYLGEAYILGFNHYDDKKSEEAISRVRDINYYIFSLYIPTLEKKPFFDEFDNLGMKEWYLKGKDWCLEYFERIYRRLGTKFNNYYLESDMSNKGLNLVLENTKPNGKGIFEQDQGSVIYRADESKGLHTRVFVNSDGLPTYEAKELALAFQKFNDEELDESITITGNEQSGYFKVVFDAIEQLQPQFAKKSKHFSHGMVKLPNSQKMSSRKGEIIGGEWLLNETRDAVKKLMEESSSVVEGDIDEISDKIAVAAVKYSFLKVSVGKDLVFDLNKSISFDGDTGPYLLYVYARCKSLLEGQSFDCSGSDLNFKNPHIKDLARAISKYREVLLSSALNYSPNILCSYLFNLGQAFNSLYQNVRILDSQEKESLLLLVNATAEVMKHGLCTLGIDVVERM
ncbi:MAG: arginine--tRNA ligase [Candidatus Dojkabacteria bacterium]